MGKFNPTEEELNPNLKFTRNRIASILSNDPDFLKIIKKKKLSWEQYDVLLRHLYDTIKTRDYYKQYMESPSDSLRKMPHYGEQFLRMSLRIMMSSRPFWKISAFGGTMIWLMPLTGAAGQWTSWERVPNGSFFRFI